MKRAVFAIALAACGAQGQAMNTDANSGGDAAGDAGQSCIALTVSPTFPVVGDHVRVSATVGGAGVPTYTWLLDGHADTDYEAADHSAIGFEATTATSHFVSVDVTGVAGCFHDDTTISVGNPTGQIVTYRLRAVPPLDLAPPQEVVVQVHGGQSFDRTLILDTGEHVLGAIKMGSTLKAGYVKFVPLVGPTFDTVTGTGNFDVHLMLQAHSVIVVPADNTLAPKLVGWMPGMGMNTFQVDAGTAWSGVVHDRGGAPLQNAQVQLTSGGVPSTLATTAANGGFSVAHTFAPNAMVTVTVTPPPGSGLSRLAATAAFDQASSVQISYAASPATCDLAATPVQRGGNDQGNAGVTIVGALATAGTITTGLVMATASGEVHVTTTANGGGTLPSTIVPRSATLSAVVTIAAGDLAVAALDTSAGCASHILDAPAAIAELGTTRTFAQANIAGVRVEATPIGALAMASLVPVEATSGAQGAFSIALAAGAHYELRFTDPGGRGAPLVFDDLVAGGVPPNADLPLALAITGEVSINGDPNPIENAPVEVLCTNCSGVAASRPIAQTATDITSHYRIAAPDPGM
jgi:hypothetical protein